jgi:hypothetical protein
MSTGEQYGDSTKSLNEVFEARGLTLLRNPATFYKPGTLLRSESSSAADMAIACDDYKAFADIASRVRSSPTSAFSVNLANKKSLEGNVALTNLASVAAEYGRDATVTVEILNPELAVISHASMQSATVDKGCLDHMQVKLAQQLAPQVTMITEAFTADVTIKVHFAGNSALSADARNGLLTKISRSLGADSSANLQLASSNSGDATLTGSRLVWGIKHSKEAVTWWMAGRNVNP